MQMRSHLGRVRGLGSSNDGIHHWWMQRLSGVALVPLCLWFVFSVVGLLVNADLPTVTDWVGRHYNPASRHIYSMASWSPSQSAPLTVSYICHSQ